MDKVREKQKIIAEVNRVSARCMRIIMYFLLVFFSFMLILNKYDTLLLGILTVACLFISLIPILIVNILKFDKSILTKHIIIICTVIITGIYITELTYYAFPMMLFPILIASLYYNRTFILYTSLLETAMVVIAEFIQELPEERLVQAFRLLPKELAADVFVNMDEDVQKKLITLLTNNEATSIIEDMFTDDAADLFEEMPAVMVTKLLSGVSKETRIQINRLLKYPDNSAGSLMAMEYIHLKKGLTIKESIERIRKQKDDFVSYDSCFVTDKDRTLLGYVTVKDILINDPDTLIDDIMQECEHKVNTLTDQEDVAMIFKDYDYSTLPVVDMEDRLVGIITIDDIVDIMEAETTEDIDDLFNGGLLNAVLEGHEYGSGVTVGNGDTDALGGDGDIVGVYNLVALDMTPDLQRLVLGLLFLTADIGNHVVDHLRPCLEGLSGT